MKGRAKGGPVQAFASCSLMDVYETGGHWGKSGAGERGNGAGTGRAGAGAGGFDLEGGS